MLSRLLEVCPRKQSGTCTTAAARSNDPKRLMGADGKGGRQEEEMSHREKKYRGQICFD